MEIDKILLCESTYIFYKGSTIFLNISSSFSLSNGTKKQLTFKEVSWEEGAQHINEFEESICFTTVHLTSVS